MKFEVDMKRALVKLFRVRERCVWKRILICSCGSFWAPTACFSGQNLSNHNGRWREFRGAAILEDRRCYQIFLLSMAYTAVFKRIWGKKVLEVLNDTSCSIVFFYCFYRYQSTCYLFQHFLAVQVVPN